MSFAGRLAPMAAAVGVGAMVFAGGSGVAAADDAVGDRVEHVRPADRGRGSAGVSARRASAQPRAIPRRAATGRGADAVRPRSSRPAASAVPAARARGAGASGAPGRLAALFNNQTPRLSPVQVAQSPAGVVTGRLNAVDPDSPVLTYTVSGQPSRGVAAVSTDGSYTYTPDQAAAATGVTDSFRVTVSDAASGFAIHGLAGLLHLVSFGLLGDRGDSSTSTVTVTVTAVGSGNRPPTGTYTLNAPDRATGSVAGVVRGSDADGDTLAYSAPATTGKGAVVLDGDTGVFTYTPTAEARAAAGAPGATDADRSDSFPVTITDGRGASGSVVVAVPVASSSAVDHRQEMRDFVIRIARQARAEDPGFIVIPQNGQELITVDGEPDGPLAADYAAVIDGQGREDLFYGYNFDNVPTPGADRDHMLDFLSREEAEGIEVLVTDYCSSPAFIDDSYRRNAALGFISFAANHRGLDNLPRRPAVPPNVSAADIGTLADARNFLYVLDPGGFGSRARYLDALAATNHDLLIIDAFYDEDQLTAAEVARLQHKADGGRRLVIAYLSIGEAEDYRYYWQAGWRVGAPSWLDEENADFAGNFKVRYWDPGWQSIILDGPDGYLNRITGAGFDGVYLDLIDAFEFYESELSTTATTSDPR